MVFKKIHLLVNPYASSSKVIKQLPELKKILKDAHVDFEVTVSDFKGSLINYARITSNKIGNDSSQIIVAVGGDGTLNQIINGIKLSRYPDQPLIFLAQGKGNDFSRDVNVPHTPGELLKLISNPTTINQIDLGYYRNLNHPEELYFVTNFGIGLDAHVISLMNDSPLQRFFTRIHLDRLVYIFNIFRSYLSQTEFEVNLKDAYRKKTFYHTLMVNVTNHPYLGGGIKLLPRATSTNQKLDLVVIEKPRFWQLPGFFYKLLKNGQHVNSSFFHFYEAEKFTVITKPLQPGQLDGEELGSHTFELEFKISSFNLIQAKEQRN